jgi:hypothetical protein
MFIIPSHPETSKYSHYSHCVCPCTCVGGENELWELEQQHLHERHQLAKHQLKEAFLMHRHQMHCRHEKVMFVQLV